MKRTALRLAPLAAFFCLTGTQAATDKANVSRVYDDIVAPADQQAYEAGVKTFNQCLHEHGFKFTWTAWNHETGDTYEYSYVSDGLTWADFDTMHATIGPCAPVWQSAVNPHLKGEGSSFAESMPKLSHMPKGSEPNPKLMAVTLFTLKQGHVADEAFNHAVEALTAAANKSNWPGHYEFVKVRYGGADAPDYILLSDLSKNWADFGTEINPPFWKMVEGIYGKAKTAELRKTLGDTIMRESQHVDSYNADLTYRP
ncbi:MAG: hypothetical protein KGJ55_03640 [Gammaproteobacteria bacterium]|nr:hypothetical protein [Gammaproteobacteria bacterium]